jgi:DNA-binding NarL/FixJ family response regulator
MIEVFIVDDHALVRDGLRRLLQDCPDIRVVGETREGREAVQLVQQLQPDIVLMDLSLPGIDGLEATKQIVKEDLKTRVIMLTMHANGEYALRVLQAGARGFVAKDDPSKEIEGAIRKVAAGGIYLSSILAEQLPTLYSRGQVKPPSLEALSDRELQVLKRLAEGQTARSIAQALCISVKTVDTHRAHLLEKLNLKTTVDLIRFALRNGLIEDLY